MTGDNRDERTSWLIVSVITSLAFAARWFRAADAFGGFHSFNEAWYTTIARNYDSPASLFFPISTFGDIDYNVSPFLSWLLYAAGSAFGFDEPVMRFVPILFSSMTVPLIFLIGRRFFNGGGGLCAAALYAFMPVSIVAGRNVQTDPVYVFFMLSSLVFYLRRVDDGLGIVNMAAAGFLFGISFLTKQFAAIFLTAVFIWEVLRQRGLRWLDPGRLLFGACALIVAGPYFIYHIITNYGEIVNSQSSLSASQFVPASLESAIYLLPEYLWGMSPCIAAAGTVAFLYYLIRKNEGASLAILATLAFGWFFLHWHGHSYYLLFAAPFISLLAGGLIGSFRSRAARILTCSLICFLALAQSVSMLCEFKYGFNEYPAVVEAVKEHTGEREPLLVAADGVAGSYYPVLKYYAGDMRIITEKELVSTGESAYTPGPGINAYIVGFVPEDVSRFPPVQLIVKRKATSLFIFGFQVRTLVRNEHFFMIDDIQIKRKAGPLAFGVLETGYAPSLSVGVVPQGGAIPVGDGKIDFRNNRR